MLTILVLLSFLSAIHCQNIAMSLCDALQDNGGSIGYSMSIPTGTDHRKYLIVKDRFWEVEYKANGSEIIGGELKLKKRFSKRVNFFHTEENHDKYYNFGFGAKFIDKRVTVNHWNQTIIVLVNMDANPQLNESLIRMELVYPNFDDLPLEDTVNMWDYKADTYEMVKDYKNFRPHLVFQSFSNQEDTYSVLIEQKLTGQDNPKYKLQMNTSRITNATSGAKQIPKQALASIPQSVEKVLGFYSVKGLFGVSFPNAPEDKRNGTIFFIEICDTPVTNNGCKGQKTLVYCMASEADSDPLADDQNCAFGSTQNRLFDCLGPEPPPEETTTEAPSPPPPPPPPPPPQDNSPQTPTPTKKEGGGMWWIIVLIVVILLIIGALLLAFLLMRKSSKEDDEMAKAGASPSGQGGPESSTRSRDSTAPGAVPPSTVEPMTSTRSTAGPNGPKAGPQSTLGPMNSTRSSAPNSPNSPTAGPTAGPTSTLEPTNSTRSRAPNAANAPPGGPQSTLEPMTSTRSSAPNSPNSPTGGPTAGPTAGPTSTLEPTNSTRSKAPNAPNAPPGGPKSTLEPTTSTTSTRSTASNR